MSSSQTNMSITSLAARRYQDIAQDIAVMFFMRDRQDAGLGALDVRRRRGTEISRTKRVDYETGVVLYRMSICRPKRFHYQPLGPLDHGENWATATVTIAEVPAVRQCGVLRVKYRNLPDQLQRSIIAADLWKLRREMRCAAT